MEDDRRTVAAYRPGSGTALVAGSCLVLLGPEVSRATATELWPMLDRAMSLEELVEVVLEIGLRKLPTIAIAFRVERETHVLLRGKARGVLESADAGEQQLLDSDARTWKEHTAHGPVRLFLGSDSDGEYLPLSSGVVPADALLIGWSGAPHLADSDLFMSSTPTLDEPSAVAVARGDRSDPLAVLPDVAEAVSAVDHVEPTYPDETLTETAFEELSSQEDRPAAPTAVVAPVANVHPWESPHAVALPSVSGVDLDQDNFDDLFGATRLPLPVEHAAVRDDEPEPEFVGAPSEAATSIDEPVTPSPISPIEADLGTGAFLPPSARGPAVPVIGPPSAEGALLIEGVPGGLTGSHTRRPAEASSSVRAQDAPMSSPLSVPATGQVRPIASSDALEFDDGGSMTVSRSTLGKMRNKAVPPPPPSSGQTVHGVLCDSGHPNPPAATVCRVCSLPLELVDAVSMPRPVLGVLRFSNGVEVELDRPVMIGRAPKAERVSAREIPQLVSLPSPDKDISRNHVEVKLDGWHVIVVDLGSTNGTVVTLPGQSPERLRAQEEQPISPGTVVTIAEEITFVYEVPA
jgi:hypothetical protein